MSARSLALLRDSRAVGLVKCGSQSIPSIVERRIWLSNSATARASQWLRGGGLSLASAGRRWLHAPNTLIADGKHDHDGDGGGIGGFCAERLEIASQIGGVQPVPSYVSEPGVPTRYVLFKQIYTHIYKALKCTYMRAPHTRHAKTPHQYLNTLSDIRTHTHRR